MAASSAVSSSVCEITLFATATMSRRFRSASSGRNAAGELIMLSCTIVISNSSRRATAPIPAAHQTRRRRSAHGRSQSTHGQIPGVEKRGAEREQRNDNENDHDDQRGIHERAKRTSRGAKRHQIERQPRKHHESSADRVKPQRERLEQEDKRQDADENDRVFDRL